MTTPARQLDLSPLPPAARRELLDFYQFLLARSNRAGTRRSRQATAYRFSDLCGNLSWQGDAVATQRSIRDEW